MPIIIPITEEITAVVLGALRELLADPVKTAQVQRRMVNSDAIDVGHARLPTEIVIKHGGRPYAVTAHVIVGLILYGGEELSPEDYKEARDVMRFKELGGNLN